MSYCMTINLDLGLAMERVVDWILGKLEDKQIAMACAYDLTKAFDCLPHSVIIDKLAFYGVLGKESSLSRICLIGSSM